MEQLHVGIGALVQVWSWVFQLLIVLYLGTESGLVIPSCSTPCTGFAQAVLDVQWFRDGLGAALSCYRQNTANSETQQDSLGCG